MCYVLSECAVALGSCHCGQHGHHLLYKPISEGLHFTTNTVPGLVLFHKGKYMQKVKGREKIKVFNVQCTVRLILCRPQGVRQWCSGFFVAGEHLVDPDKLGYSGM